MCAVVIVKLFMDLTFSGHSVFYLDTEALLSYITVSALEEATAVVDPCRENTLMDNLHRRHPNYTAALDDPYLCDYGLHEGNITLMT